MSFFWVKTCHVGIGISVGDALSIKFPQSSLPLWAFTCIIRAWTCIAINRSTNNRHSNYFYIKNAEVMWCQCSYHECNVFVTRNTFAFVRSTSSNLKINFARFKLASGYLSIPKVQITCKVRP